MSFDHPVRDGSRGGRDQFSWDNVKQDKDRECYLGHSIMAPVGRWQQGKDLYWYAKTRQEDAQSKRAEFSAAKQIEEDAMMVALGYKVQKKGDPKDTLTEDEIHEITKREGRQADEKTIEQFGGVGSTKDPTSKNKNVEFDRDAKAPVQPESTFQEEDAATAAPEYQNEGELLVHLLKKYGIEKLRKLLQDKDKKKKKKKKK